MVNFAGFNMPVSYSKGINSECDAVRSDVGVFDVSHMGQILIEGSKSFEFVQYLTTNNVSKVENHQCQYTLLCNEDGGIIDDLILYRIEENKFLLVVNASNVDKDYKWIKSQLDDRCSVLDWSTISIEDLSLNISLIALQGPNSRSILSNFNEFTDCINDLKFYHFNDFSEKKDLKIISRTGYTGELGYEIYGSHNFIKYVWDRLINDFNVSPIGLAARDILRLEMCYRLYGNDMNEDISPYECGLNWVVASSDSEEFIGRNAVINKQKNRSKKIVCLEMKDKCIPRKGYRLISNENDIGYISSGSFSPNLKKGIAMGFIDTDKSVSNDIYVKVRDKLFSVEVIKGAFLKETSLFE